VDEDRIAECWRDFALAIVRKAVEDYRVEVRRALDGDDRARQLSSLEAFFRSGYCKVLCGRSVEPRNIAGAVWEDERRARRGDADD
jgi:hypothetical protein